MLSLTTTQISAIVAPDTGSGDTPGANMNILETVIEEPSPLSPTPLQQGAGAGIRIIEIAPTPIPLLSDLPPERPSPVSASFPAALEAHSSATHHRTLESLGLRLAFPRAEKWVEDMYAAMLPEFLRLR